MNYNIDERIILTLDAGGTNFVFSALQKGEIIIEPITLPSNGHDLSICIDTIKYDSKPRVAIVTSKLGAAQAISIGAYCFALKKLDLKRKY